MANPHVVILHGANGAGSSMEPLAAPLRAHANVLCPDLPGHAGRPIPPRFSVQDQAADLIGLLDREGIERATFAGYSMGGYTATYLARHFPARVVGVCAIATRFLFDEETVKHWVYLAQPERLERPGNTRGAELEKLHGPEWRTLTLRGAGMYSTLASDPPLRAEDFPAITRPVMLVNGNRDTFLPWSETLDAAAMIPGAKLVMFYGIAHPMRNVPFTQVAAAMAPWIAEISRP